MTTAPTIAAEVAVTIGGDVLTLTMAMPLGPTAMGALLPLMNDLASAVAARGAAAAVARGRTISCRVGCGACCRQPVPLAPAEARALAALVAALPEPRRTRLRNRFAAAQATLDAAAVPVRGDVLFGRPTPAMGARVAAYMAAGVACPFLDDEACSIYPDRPTICREYLVTSPAENCASPDPATVDRVVLATSVSTALATADSTAEGLRRVLLVDSLDWVAAHPAPPATVPGPELVGDVFARLTTAS